MKCLPASKIPEANGIGLHDWHAEILAIRTFNRFILDECARIAENGSSELIEISSPSESSRPFRLRQGIKLHMYASEAPCKLLILSRSRPPMPVAYIPRWRR